MNCDVMSIDKLITKKAKELNENKLSPSQLDQIRWVGVVNADGSVVLPPNQSGEALHSHYGFESRPNKFSYWPSKKAVSWWVFPEDEELVIKVEDYLIRRGFTVNKHIDAWGREIKKALSEITYRNMIESSMKADYQPSVLYHATYEPLVNSILHHGIVPGGKEFKNFDWSKDFVYLAAAKNNAISFIESSENENIPEEWFDQIVALAVDVSKLDKSKLTSDEHWNPDITDEEDGWQSYQYMGIIPPNAITVL